MLVIFRVIVVCFSCILSFGSSVHAETRHVYHAVSANAVRTCNDFRHFYAKLNAVREDLLNQEKVWLACVNSTPQCDQALELEKRINSLEVVERLRRSQVKFFDSAQISESMALNSLEISALGMWIELVRHLEKANTSVRFDLISDFGSRQVEGWPYNFGRSEVIGPHTISYERGDFHLFSKPSNFCPILFHDGASPIVSIEIANVSKALAGINYRDFTLSVSLTRDHSLSENPVLFHWPSVLSTQIRRAFSPGIPLSDVASSLSSCSGGELERLDQFISDNRREFGALGELGGAQKILEDGVIEFDSIQSKWRNRYRTLLALSLPLPGEQPVLYFQLLSDAEPTVAAFRDKQGLAVCF